MVKTPAALCNHSRVDRALSHDYGSVIALVYIKHEECETVYSMCVLKRELVRIKVR